MGFSIPAAPAPLPPPVPLPPAAHPATLGSQTPKASPNGNKGAAAVGMGFDSTLATGPQGLETKPNQAKTTLLGG